MSKSFAALLVSVLLCFSFGAPLLAQTPAPPDPAVVLARAEAAAGRADEVARLAEQSASQTNSAVALVNTLLTILSVVGGVIVAVLAFLGINTRNSFQQALKAHQDQLEQTRAAQQAEQTKTQQLQQGLEQKIEAIEALHRELLLLRDDVRQGFEATKQALVLMDNGNQLYNEGRRTEAIAVYERAARLDACNPEINFRLGFAYSNAGRHGEAIQALDQALRIKPDHADASKELGLAHRRRAEKAASAEEREAGYRWADHYLQQATDLNPRSADAWAVRGGFYRRQGQLEDALACYRKAAQLDESSYAMNNVASLAWGMGQIDEARRSFQQVEAIASDKLLAGRVLTFWELYDRALARLALGKREAAMEDHARAIAQTPEPENLMSVLDNLLFLERAETRIEGLDQFIRMIESRLGR